MFTIEYLRDFPYKLDHWYYSIREKENTFVINSNKIMDQYGETFKKVKKLPKRHKKLVSPILMNKKGLLDFFCTADMPFYVGAGQEEFYNCDFKGCVSPVSFHTKLE